jgi:integrase
MKIFDTFFILIARNEDKLRVKALEKNISRHENGTLYLRVRKNGKLFTKSLQTKDLKEARRKVEAEGLDSFMIPQAAREPAATALPSPPVPLPVAVEAKAGVVKVTLKQALALHAAGMIHLSKGREEMTERCSGVALKFGKDWETFDCVAIWKAYRASGLESWRKKELTSACNHLKWYLWEFVPWAISKGFLPASAKDSLSMLKEIKVNPRRIRIPTTEMVGEFLAMVETEDKDGAAFLRFMAACGLRLTGARSIQWSDVDFEMKTMTVMMKRQVEKVLPLTPEAYAVLLSRKGKERPWGFDDAEISKLTRRMKRFAKGFDMDLRFYHAFRHYFASRCLLAGLTVQEVADLLGHADQGQLVLKTYGHLCREHLKTAVASLRLVS